MRITHLTVKNFRSIETLELDLPQICALVGANNAGKSNLLAAMWRVLGKDWLRVDDFSEEDVLTQDPELDVTIGMTFSDSLPYAKLKNTEPAHVKALEFVLTRYKVGEQKGERRLEQKCLDAHGKIPMVLAKRPQRNEAHKYEPVVGIPSEVREQVPLIYVANRRTLADQLPSARYSLLRQLFSDINSDFCDPENTLSTKRAGEDVAVPRLELFHHFMARALEVLRTPQFLQLEKSITENALLQLGFDPTVDSDKLKLYFSPMDSMEFYKSLELVIQDGGHSISATRTGEGVQNAIVLAILRAFEERRKKGAILLIEEPEMFLHPQMQRSLYKTLRSIGETNQVIYSTHSPHFVTVPEYSDVALVRKVSGRTSVTVSGIPSTPELKEKLIKEFDPERNELFFAQRLLLVEGDTEKLALPQYAHRLGRDLDKAGATIVEVGGKRNLWQFALIARSFGIPTGIVYDRDSTDFRDDREEETAFNSQLDSLASQDGKCRVWCLAKDYEQVLRETLSEPVYQHACQRYSKRSKAVRARLIAADPEYRMPTFATEVLQWLSAERPGL